MAATATCPKCGKKIEGSVEDIRSHWTTCTAAKARAAAKAARPKPEPGKPVLDSVTFFIPGEITSSLNVMLHDHRGQSFADKERWRRAVHPVLAGYAPATCRRTLRIFRSAKKELDPDNLWGSAKYLIDAIKDAGALVDDKQAWLDLDVKQGWDDKRGKGMLITIIDPGEAHGQEDTVAEDTTI